MRIIAHLPQGNFVEDFVELLAEHSGSELIRFDDIREIRNRISQLQPADVFIAASSSLEAGWITSIPKIIRSVLGWIEWIPEVGSVVILDHSLLFTEKDEAEINRALERTGKRVRVLDVTAPIDTLIDEFDRLCQTQPSLA